MTQVSARLASLSPSATLAMSQKSSELKAQGVDVINLSVGEPDFNTPEPIKDAAKKVIDENYSRYSPVAGYPALRNAIVAKLKNENGLEYTANQISCANGAKQSVCNTIMVLVNPGDEVIIPAPFWVSYPEMVRMCGGIPVIVETTAENGWKLTAEQFEEAMTPRTKMVILTTPNNPTGSVYSEEELRALGEVALSEDILILADEIYEHLVYGDARHVSIASLSPELYDLTITINGFSKGYAMTGWRLGYSAAPAAIAKAIQMIQDHTTSNVCTFAQYGGIEALTGDQSFISDMRDEYDMRRQYVYSRLSAIPNISVVEPQGAFYFFVDTSRLGLTSLNLCDKLLERYKVAAVPGIAFGNDKAIRISYCTTLDILKEALDRFEEFCKAH